MRTYEILEEAGLRARAYCEQIQSRNVTPSPQALAKLVELGGALPETPTDEKVVLSILDEIGSPATIHRQSGKNDRRCPSKAYSTNDSLYSGWKC